MKPQELRIGNLLMNYHQYCKVNHISENTYGVQLLDPELDPFHDVNYKGINPIPVTGEWLERFGLITDNNKNEWYSDDFLLFRIMEIGGGMYCFANHDVQDALSVPFKYIHQLQNLYHALTGEELKYAYVA